MATIKQALIKAQKELSQAKITSANLDVEVLLSYVLKKDKAFLYAHPEKRLNAGQRRKLNMLIKRRLKNEPMAYLINKKEFFGLDFFVDKRVLIPRPETEILVEEIISTVSKKQSMSIADIGTGSGCIAVTLAKHLPQAKIYATDISKDAITIAKKNALKSKVLSRVKFFQGNLLEPLKGKKFDIIVVNLPYLTPQELKNLSLKYEPKHALDGGKDGLKYFKELIPKLNKFLKAKGRVFLEIGPRQSSAIRKLIKKHLPQAKIEVKKDLARRDRIIIIN